MRRDLIIVITCGARKVDHPAPAWQLYTGTWFKALWNWASTVVPRSRIMIMSAKHGLLHANQITAPYNVRMGDPGSVDSAAIARQVAALGRDEPMLFVGGTAYWKVLHVAAPHARRLVMKGGMGHQIQFLKLNRGQVPDVQDQPKD